MQDRLIGAVFEQRYRVRRAIARGGTAQVYLADQLPLGRPVALKILDVAAATDSPAEAERLRQQLAREARVAASLSHPNIVRVIDFWSDGPLSCLAMEHVRGPSLHAILDRCGALPPLRVVRIGRALCSGLAEAHRAGLVHRDVKPANVLLSDDGEGDERVCLVDFGLARPVREGDGRTVGTPMSMAPEQIRGESVDARTDVYAVGVLLFWALRGHPPFAAETGPAAVMVAHLRQAPPPAGAPPCLEWVVQRCLAKHPEERFGSADELGEMLAWCEAVLLDPFADPEPPGASLDATLPAPRTQPAHPVASRRRLVWAALAMVCAFAAGWWWSG